MLVLSRLPEEEIIINTSDGAIAVKVLSIRNGKVRLGVTAPLSISVLRTEVMERLSRRDDLDRLNETDLGGHRPDRE